MAGSLEGPAWVERRLGEHGKEITGLRITSKLNEQAITSLHGEHQRLTTSMANNHTAVMTSISELSGKVQFVNDDRNIKEGMKRQRTQSSIEFKWVVATLLGVFGLIIAYYASYA